MERSSVSLVSELYDDSDTLSDVTAPSAVTSPSNRSSPIPSDRMSTYSYTSSVNREFILKDLYGRIVNNTNQVRRRMCDVCGALRH